MLVKKFEKDDYQFIDIKGNEIQVPCHKHIL